MRIVKVMALAMCLLLIGTGKASAATIEEVYREQWEASGAETLPDSLPEETKKLLDSLNIIPKNPQQYLLWFVHWRCVEP